MYLVLTKAVEKKEFLDGYGKLNTNPKVIKYWDAAITLMETIVEDVAALFPDSTLSEEILEEWQYDMAEHGEHNILVNPRMIRYEEDKETRTYYRLHYISLESYNLMIESAEEEEETEDESSI